MAVVEMWQAHLDLFCVGQDGQLYGRWWDGTTGWGGWYAVGRHDASLLAPGAVAVISMWEAHLDLFCVGQDGQLYGRWWG